MEWWHQPQTELKKTSGSDAQQVKLCADEADLDCVADSLLPSPCATSTCVGVWMRLQSRHRVCGYEP